MRILIFFIMLISPVISNANLEIVSVKSKSFGTLSATELTDSEYSLIFEAFLNKENATIFEELDDLIQVDFSDGSTVNNDLLLFAGEDSGI